MNLNDSMMYQYTEGNQLPLIPSAVISAKQFFISALYLLPVDSTFQMMSRE